MTMQDTLIAGDTLNYTANLPAYSPVDGWVLYLRLTPRSGSAAVATVIGVASGSSGLVQVQAGTTAAWVAGEYGWAVWVDRAGEVYTVDSGQITVRADPRTSAAGADSRSDAELGLAAIRALVMGKATTGQMSYAINGRQLQSYSLQDLLRLEGKYKREVDAERAAAGLAPIYSSAPRTIRCRLR